MVWDASQIKPPGWDHVFAAFIDGAREAKTNPSCHDDDIQRAADGYTKRVFEEVDPVSEEALRTESWAKQPTPPQAPEAMCPCNDRPADKCPGEWEPGCDLGANEKFVRVGQSNPVAVQAKLGAQAPEEVVQRLMNGVRACLRASLAAGEYETDAWRALESALRAALTPQPLPERFARAILAAAEPVIRAEEREKCRPLIKECCDALAEELAGWDLSPPLYHVKQAHDKCEAWLAIRSLGAGSKEEPHA